MYLIIKTDKGYIITCNGKPINYGHTYESREEAEGVKDLCERLFLEQHYGDKYPEVRDE